MLGTPRYSCVALILALVATLSSQSAMAPSATADSIPISFNPWPEAEFSLRGSNGYLLKVKGTDRRVKLTAVRRGQRAEYEVRGEASAEGIEARFGGLGTVAVEFQPSGRIVHSEPLRECEGTIVIQNGAFVGTIEFTGENGYTKVRETQAAGRTRVAPPSKCPSGGGSAPPSGALLSEASSRPLDSVLMEARARGKGLFFIAISISPPGEATLTAFDAGLVERRGRMLVFRSGSASAPPRAFKFNNALTFATVKPRKPFKGSATFRRASGGAASLTGSLTVSLPGAEDIALTGSRIEARLMEYELELPEPAPA